MVAVGRPGLLPVSGGTLGLWFGRLPPVSSQLGRMFSVAQGSLRSVHTPAGAGWASPPIKRVWPGIIVWAGWVVGVTEGIQKFRRMCGE